MNEKPDLDGRAVAAPELSGRDPKQASRLTDAGLAGFHLLILRALAAILRCVWDGRGVMPVLHDLDRAATNIDAAIQREDR